MGGGGAFGWGRLRGRIVFGVCGMDFVCE